ncbi:uncharacterized protein K452DRAFT_233220 [Aplosporella prunicola CBS 121167]|uniref:CCD97-like C-terminal domain-containing protein n=1 Tax=Aplosporella prunicola CBS 121167 TaxID=1176127 RepID=A0A6A6B7A9_9PEZI|nr:uncharacterized protein K452DRAFT_233220 [Aplosporella prunicola CBS 121167]KAF2139125.1 hypothetical protein K452DRAFT_233220 [Aplosporella prunicola CBS 121167]
MHLEQGGGPPTPGQHHHQQHTNALHRPLHPETDQERRRRLRIKNRRKRYLDTHPEYFSSGLELAFPLLYDRLVRRFQTPAEREAEGRAKGYSGVLEADLLRSEAKLYALQHEGTDDVSYTRGPNGEIVATEDKDEIPATKEEGLARWREDMGQRFLRGEDRDFRYEEVDESEEWDDHALEDQEAQDDYFDAEEPSWFQDDVPQGLNGAQGRLELRGETGIQDF